MHQLWSGTRWGPGWSTRERRCSLLWHLRNGSSFQGDSAVSLGAHPSWGRELSAVSVPWVEEEALLQSTV